MGVFEFIISIASGYLGNVAYNNYPPEYIAKIKVLNLSGVVDDDAEIIKLAFKKDPSFEEDTQKYAELTNYEYLIEQSENLLQHLEQLKKEHRAFYTELVKMFAQSDAEVESLQQKLLCQLNADPASFVRELRLCCEPHMQRLQQDVELLILSLLSQIIAQEKWLERGVHELAVRTRILSELRISTRYNIPANLKKHENIGVAGKYIITEDVSTPEVGFDAEASAEQQAKIIAYQLYKKFDLAGAGLDENQLDQYDWEGINRVIATEQLGKNPQLHRFEIDARMTSSHPLLQKDVCEALHKLLPDLPIVHFGLGTEEGETELFAEVSTFFNKLYG